MKVESVHLPEKEDLTRCRQEICERCYFRKDNNCRILCDTDFGMKPCPFFKTPADKRASDHKSNKRLLRIGVKHEIDVNFF